MKRIFLIILTAVFLFACTSKSERTFQHEAFSAELPDGFEQVPNANLLCFAPNGDALLSSLITFYSTEANWYFDRYDASDYQDALESQCGYETLSVNEVYNCSVDGFEAKRISCNVQIDQGEHTLIIYAINAEQTLFFTLLNRDADTYIDAFDNMMHTMRLKGNQ